MATTRLNARARLSCTFPAVFAWREASVECEARHAPDASDRLASFSREGEEAGHFYKVTGVSIVVAGVPRSETNTLTVNSQVA